MNLRTRLARLERNAPEDPADVDAHFDRVVTASLKAAFDLWPEEVSECLNPVECAILARMDPDLLGRICP